LPPDKGLQLTRSHCIPIDWAGLIASLSDAPGHDGQ
jgi:hypothetical protein